MFFTEGYNINSRILHIFVFLFLIFLIIFILCLVFPLFEFVIQILYEPIQLPRIAFLEVDYYISFSDHDSAVNRSVLFLELTIAFLDEFLYILGYVVLMGVGGLRDV